MKKWLIALGITVGILGVFMGLVGLLAFFPWLALLILACAVFGVVLYFVKDSLD